MTCIDWENTTSNNTNQYSPNNSIYSLFPIRSAWNPHSMSDHSPSSSSSSLPPEQTFNGSLVLLIKQPKTTHHPEMVMDDVALPHKLIPPLLECLDQSMHRQRINKWSRFPIHSAFTLCRWSLIRIWIQMSNSFARWDPLFLFHGSLSLCLCVWVETRDKCVRHHQLHEQANRCPTDYIHLSMYLRVWKYWYLVHPFTRSRTHPLLLLVMQGSLLMVIWLGLGVQGMRVIWKEGLVRRMTEDGDGEPQTERCRNRVAVIQGQ